MATRSRPRKPAKKAAAKKTAAKKVANSKIAEAQKAAQDSLRGLSQSQRNPNPAGVGTAGGPEKPAKPTPPKPGVAGKAISKGDPNYPKNQTNPTKLPSTGAPRDPLLAGLSSPVEQKKNEEQAATIRATNAARQKSPIANPSLYGVSTAKRAENLAARIAAADATVAASKAKGNAVWMGIDPNAPTVKLRRQGPERMDEFGGTTDEAKVQPLVMKKDDLLAWLSDDAKVAEIKAAAEKAGFTIESYDDVSKLWNAVVSQAASSYSLSDKQVTPWALIALRGKYLVNGKPADKVTTNTSIDEMDPAQARLMFEQTAQQALGRSPTKAEVDDFIAKAQTIAKENPGVTTTTHHLGIDGNEESATSVTKGGADVVNAKAQVAALDQARQSEDYQAYQAAGNYFPMLFEALSSPV